MQNYIIEPYGFRCLETTPMSLSYLYCFVIHHSLFFSFLYAVDKIKPLRFYVKYLLFHNTSINEPCSHHYSRVASILFIIQ